MASDSLELRARLENLPQELYDEIVTITFTATGGVVQIYNSRYPRPDLKFMQVSRATRAKYSCSHYDKTTYIVRDAQSCGKWIKSMPIWHLKLLKGVKCRRRGPLDFPWLSAFSKGEILRQIEHHGMSPSTIDFDYVVS